MLTSCKKPLIFVKESFLKSGRTLERPLHSVLSHSAIILLIQHFMGHFTVVTLMYISAALSEEVAKEGDLWDSEIRLNSLGLLSLDKALSTVC